MDIFFKDRYNVNIRVRRKNVRKFVFVVNSLKYKNVKCNYV